MKTDIPPCTILIPVYNGEKFIENSLSNILEIARPGDEILYIDDGSTDRTVALIENAISMNAQVKLIKRQHEGLVATLNYGIRRSANEFIARADIDDRYRADRLYLQIDYMDKNPDVTALFSDYRFSGLGGKNLGLIRSAVHPELTKLSLLNPQRTPHPSVMFRKSAVTEVGGYFVADFPAEDLSLWMKLSRLGKIASLPEELLNYQISLDGITQNNQLKMSTKTKELTREFSKSLIYSNDFLDLVKEQISMYRSLDDGEVRTLLTLRDLAKYFAIADIPRLEMKEFARIFMTSISIDSMKQTLSMKFMMRLRNRMFN